MRGGRGVRGGEKAAELRNLRERGSSRNLPILMLLKSEKPLTARPLTIGIGNLDEYSENFQTAFDHHPSHISPLVPFQW